MGLQPEPIIGDVLVFFVGSTSPVELGARVSMGVSAGAMLGFDLGSVVKTGGMSSKER